MNIDPDGIQLYIPDKHNSNNTVRLCPPECLHDLQPYGMLQDYMIVGMKKNKLQIMPFGDQNTIDSPKSLKEVYITDFFEHGLLRIILIKVIQ